MIRIAIVPDTFMRLSLAWIVGDVGGIGVCAIDVCGIVAVGNVGCVSRAHDQKKLMKIIIKNI